MLDTDLIIPAPALIAAGLMLLILSAAGISAARWRKLDQAGALAGAAGTGEARQRFFEAQTHARDALSSLTLALSLIITLAIMGITS